MAGPPQKTVFLSYAEGDRDHAMALREVLQDLDEGVWVRDFDLSAGEAIAETVAFAISEASWFLLIISSHALSSPWVKYDANIATFRSLSDHNFRLITILVDDSTVPTHLELALASAATFRLRDYSTAEDAFIEIATLIDRAAPAAASRTVYVDRGSDADRFALLARRNRIVFILGLPGIGKTSFVQRSVKERLRKEPRRISLTRGHSLDLLAREVIQALRMPQPKNSESDDALVDAALAGLTARADKFFLLLDDAETALGATNTLQSYILRFLTSFLHADIHTHIVLVLTRNFDYPPSIADSTDLLRLDRMDDVYVRECLELWLEGHPQREEILDAQLDELVDLAGGHPLAAKMVSTLVRVLPVSEALLPQRKERTRMRLAEHILRSIDQSQLTDLDHLILRGLATVKEPLRLEDLLSVRYLKTQSLDNIHAAWSKLSDLLFVQQDGELLSLHSFIEAYVREQLLDNQVLFGAIARDLGDYTFQKAIEHGGLVQRMMGDKGIGDEDREGDIVRLSNEAFRYAVSAAKLLGYVGDEERIKQLPIRVKGTLRELVFFFYQEKRDYRKVLEYAGRWLRIAADDSEVMLYQARAYRSIGELSKALAIIETLESDPKKNKWLESRLWRERGLIAQVRGKTEQAKEYFTEGIAFYIPFSFPGNHLGLARLLLNEAEDLPFHMEDRQVELANQALELLDTVRAESTRFDRFTLEAYIEALMLGGLAERALPMLGEILADRPDDPRWNDRMAEVLRKRGAYVDARKYAERAVERGAPKAPLTLANVLYSEATELQALDFGAAEARLRAALNALAKFRADRPRDQEVADAIRAKIYRAMNDWDGAKRIIFRYGHSSDPYIIYEQCRVKLWESEDAHRRSDVNNAMKHLDEAIEIIARYKNEYRLTDALRDVEADLRSKKLDLKEGRNDDRVQI